LNDIYGASVPTKKTTLADSERSKRIRETAGEAETSNDPADFERAFATVARGTQKAKKQSEPDNN
jgi:hypothetical protein